MYIKYKGVFEVSTHSRPKAAGQFRRFKNTQESSFNTQPPEGGWLRPFLIRLSNVRFNTQPPEGGWTCQRWVMSMSTSFQHTAARRRLGDF